MDLVKPGTLKKVSGFNEISQQHETYDTSETEFFILIYHLADKLFSGILSKGRDWHELFEKSKKDELPVDVRIKNAEFEFRKIITLDEWLNSSN